MKTKSIIKFSNTSTIKIDQIEALENNTQIQLTNTYEINNDYSIYTKQEILCILKEIESIEKRIISSWEESHKLIFILEYLKKHIIYSPKYEKLPKKQTNSLRGIISKETSKEGLAIILNELLLRQGISCTYKSENNHYWNIVTIKGEKYSIDLASESNRFRKGDTSNYHFLNQKELEVIKVLLDNNNEPNHQAYTINRKDGTSFIISQVGTKRINNTNYYRYYYQDIMKDKKRKLIPIILYSDENLTYYFNAKKYKEYTTPGYNDAIKNILFSKKNIKDSLLCGTFYIGSIRKSSQTNQYQLVLKPDDIKKERSIRNLFQYRTKIFTREDNTTFIVQQNMATPIEINKTRIYQYDIYELLEENKKNIFVQHNQVYTEKDFLENENIIIPNQYLSKENIKNCVEKEGGYLGYIDKENKIKKDKEIQTFFKNNTSFINSSIEGEKNEKK